MRKKTGDFFSGGLIFLREKKIVICHLNKKEKIILENMRDGSIQFYLHHIWWLEC